MAQVNRGVEKPLDCLAQLCAENCADKRSIQVQNKIELKCLSLEAAFTNDTQFTRENKNRVVALIVYFPRFFTAEYVNYRLLKNSMEIVSATVLVLCLYNEDKLTKIKMHYKINIIIPGKNYLS